MTFTDKSTAQYILNTDKHRASLNTLPFSSSSSSSSLSLAVYPPLLFSLPPHSLCTFSATPSVAVLLSFTTHPSICPSVLPRSHTSSIPPPAPSSATSPCLPLSPSLTLITHFLSLGHYSSCELKVYGSECVRTYSISLIALYNHDLPLRIKSKLE